jgi:hypothetical protein
VCDILSQFDSSPAARAERDGAARPITCGRIERPNCTGSP